MMHAGTVSRSLMGVILLVGSAGMSGCLSLYTRVVEKSKDSAVIVGISRSKTTAKERAEDRARELLGAYEHTRDVSCSQNSEYSTTDGWACIIHVRKMGGSSIAKQSESEERRERESASRIKDPDERTAHRSERADNRSDRFIRDRDADRGQQKRTDDKRQPDEDIEEGDLEQGDPRGRDESRSTRQDYRDLPRARFSELLRDHRRLQGKKFQGTLYPRRFYRIPRTLASLGDANGSGKVLLMTTRDGGKKILLLVPRDKQSVIRARIESGSKMSIVYTPVAVYKARYPVLRYIAEIPRGEE